MEDLEIETTATSGDYDIVDPSWVDPDEPLQSSAEPEQPADDPVRETVQEVEQQAVIPPDLLEQAGQLGFQYDDIKALGTPEAVRVAVEKQALLSGQVSKSEEVAESPPVDDNLEGLKGLKEKGFDEDLVQQLVESFGGLTAQNAELKQQMEEMRKEHASRVEDIDRQTMAAEAGQLVKWFDEKFAELPEGYSAKIGVGNTADIGRDTSEFDNREKIAQKYMKIREDWQGWGYSGPDDASIFDDAVHLAIGSHSKTEAREELKGKLRKSGSQVTSRPTHTQRSIKDPRESAAAFANQHPLFGNSGR